MNSVIQGSAADIIKLAMISTHRRLREEGLGARLVLQIHDELLFEVPDSEMSTVTAARARGDGRAPTTLDPPLEVDVGVGDTWLAAKELAARDAAWRADSAGFVGFGVLVDEHDRPDQERTDMNHRPLPKPTAELVAADPGVWIEVDGQMVPDYDATLSDFARGRRRHGPGRPHRQGRDPRRHRLQVAKASSRSPSCRIRRSVNPDDEVPLGDEVDALVMQKEDADGRLILSKKRARFEKAWKRIEAAAESGEPVEGNVIEVVKGGLIIDLGVRGFLPASLVDIRRVQDLEEFRGQTLRCKVIELNRSRNNVVLSRRAVLEEERREVRQRILDDLEPGKVVEGVISNIVDFGAFVDLDGIDGLIHISELSWSHVNHPSEILEIGQSVRVKVLDIDRDRQRISLGLKQTQADPWQQRARELPAGRRRRGPRDEGRHVRRLRRDPAGRRGPRAHLRARRPPRREPARGRRPRATSSRPRSSTSTPSAAASRSP